MASDRADPPGLEWVRKNLPIAILTAGLVGAGYITQEKVTAHEARLSRIEGWQQTTQSDLAARRERDAANERSAAELRESMAGVQRTLGSLQLTLARMCAGLKVRCE